MVCENRQLFRYHLLTTLLTVEVATVGITSVLLPWKDRSGAAHYIGAIDENFYGHDGREEGPNVLEMTEGFRVGALDCDVVG